MMDGSSTSAPRVECKFCELKFHGGFTRINAHLLGVERHGVGPCPNVPAEVQEELRKKQEARDVAANKKRRLSDIDSKTGSSSQQLVTPPSGKGQPSIRQAFKQQNKELVSTQRLHAQNQTIVSLVPVVVERLCERQCNLAGSSGSPCLHIGASSRGADVLCQRPALRACAF